MELAHSSSPPSMVGRYALFGEIAHGGMATVHVGRLVGPAGFSRTVAIKRLHPTYAKDPEFVAMFMDEARLAARLHHPNVVPIIDVVASRGELLLVMDYVPGDSLSALMRAEQAAGTTPDVRVMAKIMTDVLGGLHAAHEARNERGMELNIVHRDVSPQNILVGTDGAAHLIDFGVAKAAGRAQNTSDGQIKGKVAYMAPEQIRNLAVDRRTDVYAAAVVLWEGLAGRRRFDGQGAGLIYQVLEGKSEPPSHYNPAITAALDKVVLKGLHIEPSQRFQSTLEMAEALEHALTPASSMQVARWLEKVATTTLHARARLVAEVESLSDVYPAQLAATPIHEDNTGSGSHRDLSPPDLRAPVLGQEDPSSGVDKIKAEPLLQSVPGVDAAQAPVPQTRNKTWLVAAGALGGAMLLAAVVGYVAGKKPEEPAQQSRVGDSLDSLPEPGVIDRTALSVPLAPAEVPSARTEEPGPAAASASASGAAPPQDAGVVDAAARKPAGPSGPGGAKPQPGKPNAQEKYGF